jgi:hypothetical protein
MCETSAPLLLDTLETSEHQGAFKPPTPYARWTSQKKQNVYNTLRLVQLNSPLKGQYKTTLDCGSFLMQQGDTFSWWKCKKKWCSTCQNIRTADLINGFKHILEDFKEPTLVVLTMKNCKGKKLKDRYKKMIHAFKLARRNVHKTYGMNIDGIRTWECTYNEEEDTYHPHFNIIVDGREVAELLVMYWMNYWNTIKPGYCSMKGQYISAISSSKDLLEVFKYVTKLSVSEREEVKAQDWVFQCTRGKRLVQTFGKLKKVKIEEKEHHEEKVEGTTTEEDYVDFWWWDTLWNTYRNSEGEILATWEEVKAYQNEKERKRKKHEERYKPK